MMTPKVFEHPHALTFRRVQGTVADGSLGTILEVGTDLAFEFEQPTTPSEWSLAEIAVAYLLDPTNSVQAVSIRPCW